MPLPTPRACIERDGNPNRDHDGTEAWAPNFLFPSGWTEHRKVCIRSRDNCLPLGRGDSFSLGGLLANAGPLTVFCASAVALLVLNHFARWDL